MKLGAFLVGLSGPIVKTALRALGIGVVTAVGVDVALSGLLGAAKDAWSGLPGAVAAYVSIAGVNTGIALIAGAMVARVAMIPLKTMRLL